MSLNRPRSLAECRLGVQAAPSLKRLLAGRERLQTGFVELDTALGGGIPVPTLCILGAKPKCGKSTLLLHIASHIVTECHGYAYVVDLENGMDRLLTRLMCSLSSVDPSSLGDSFLPTDAWKVTEEQVTAGALSKRLFIETERRFDAALLESRIAEVTSTARAEGVPFIVIIDSLQKLTMNLQDRRAGIDGWIRELERMREKYGAVILIASELKRPQQGSAYKPTEVSLKESGDLEYCADLVLTLDRAEDKDDSDFASVKAPEPATLRIQYNRDGQTGKVARYGLVYPYHRIQEIAFPETKLIRPRLAAVSPIRPDLETD